MSASGMLKSINQTPPFTIFKAWVLAVLVTGISLFWLDIPIIANIISSFQGLEPRVQLDVYDPKSWLLIAPQIAIFFLYYLFVLMYSQAINAYRYSLIFVYIICLVINAIIANIYVLYSTFEYLYYDFSSMYTIWDVYKQILGAHQLSIFINIGFFIYLLFEFFISPSVKRVEKKEKKEARGNHGSAELAETEKMKEIGFMHPARKALFESYIMYVIGMYNKHYLGANVLENTITIGKRGTGKATTGSILTLLEAMINCLVNDVKGELFMTTFQERIRRGKRVIAADVVITLDRYNNFRSHMCIRYNPLWCEFLKNTNTINKALYLDAIASSFIMDAFDNREEHWVDKSRSVFKAFLSMAIEYNIQENKNISNAIIQITKSDFVYVTDKDTIYTLQDLNDGEFVKALDGKLKIVDDYSLKDFDAIKSKKSLRDVKRYFAMASKEDLEKILTTAYKTTPNSFIEEALGTLKQAGKDNELGGILTTLNKATSMLSNEAIAGFFDSPTQNDVQLDIKDYITGNTDIFFICPEDQLREYPQLLALFMNMIRVGIKLIDRREKHFRYLLLMDEIGQLGYLPCIETIDSIGRDSGLIQHLYFQTMDQVNKYKDKNALKNFEIQRYFKTTEPETIRHINYLAGRSTIIEEHQSTSKNTSRKDKQITNSDKEFGVDLMPVDRIRTLPDNEQIVVFNGEMIICNKVYYYKDKKYDGKYGKNYILDKYQHLCKPYSCEDNYVIEVKKTDNELNFSDTSKFKNKLYEMFKNKDDLIMPKGNNLYIDYDTVKKLILNNSPDTNLNNFIQSLLDSNIILLEDVEGEHLYKINLS